MTLCCFSEPEELAADAELLVGSQPGTTNYDTAAELVGEDRVAIALAGSFTSDAEVESVMVARKKEGELVATRLNLKKEMDFTTESSFFYLQPDDIVFVPQTHLSKSGEIAKHIASILFFRGWSVSFGGEDF